MWNRSKIWMPVAALSAIACALVVPRPQPSEPTHEGRPVSEWVREALDAEHWAATTNARYIVSSKIKGPAVPYIVRELRSRRYPKYYFNLYRFQAHLPRRLWLLAEPKDPNGLINAAAFTLCEMGEAARPGFAELARCIDGAPMSLLECQEVMGQLIQAGPIAVGALPHLRRLAAGTDSTVAVQAAMAIYNTDNTTNALAIALDRHLAQANSFGSVSRELWWFREDERLNSVVLPLLCRSVADPDYPITERKEIIDYLGDVVTSNTLPRLTLEGVLRSTENPDLRQAAQQSLERLNPRQL